MTAPNSIRGSRRSRPSWPLLLLGVGAACSEAAPARPCPPDAVEGYRLLARIDDRTVPVFDAERLPEGLIEPAPPTVEGDIERPAEIELRIARHDGTECRLKALWGDPPESSPGVAKAAAQRAAGDVEAAGRTIETALATATVWDRLWLTVERARNAAARNDPRAAKLRWLEASEVARSLHLSSGEARRLLAASFFALKSDDLAEALALTDRARAAAETVGDLRMRGLSFYHRGLVLQEVGDLHGAARAMVTAVDELTEAASSRDLFAVYRALAVLQSKVGRSKDAQSSLQSANQLFETTQTSSSVRAQFLNDQAVVLCADDDEPDPQMVARCRELILEAIGVAESLDRRADLRLYLTNLADYELRLGRASEALQTCERARAVVSSDPFTETTLLLNEARALLALGRHEEAKSKFSDALGRARRESGGRPSESSWRALHGLGRISEARGARRVAMSQYELALAERRLAALRSGLSDSRAPLLAQGSHILEDALRLALELGPPARVFEIAESAHAEVMRGLDAGIRRSRLDPGQQAELVRRLEAYRRARAELETSTSEIAELRGRAKYRARLAHRQARRALAHQFDDFFAWLDGAAPAPTLEPVEVLELQSILDQDEGLLTLAKLEDRYVAFFVTPDGFEQAFVDADQNPLEPWGDRFAKIRHLYVAAGSHPVGRMLHRSTWPGSTDLVYARFSLSYLPHAGLLASSCHQPTGAPVVVADPENNLPFARKEGQLVAERLRPTTFMAGETASHEAVVAALSGTTLFHYAGHGSILPAHPWDAHLRLARQQRLTLEDVLMSEPKIGLAVLNACDTAAETELSERESIALAGALLALGTCTVVATDAQIADEDAATFVRGFYAQGGADQPAEAVRRTALSWHGALEAQPPPNDAEPIAPWKLFRVLGRRAPR